MCGRWSQGAIFHVKYRYNAFLICLPTVEFCFGWLVSCGFCRIGLSAYTLLTSCERLFAQYKHPGTLKVQPRFSLPAAYLPRRPSLARRGGGRPWLPLPGQGAEAREQERRPGDPEICDDQTASSLLLNNTLITSGHRFREKWGKKFVNEGSKGRVKFHVWVIIYWFALNSDDHFEVLRYEILAWQEDVFLLV